MCELNYRNWKHEYLDLADRLELFRYKYQPVGRVTELLHGYMQLVESLLYAEVNGGLDENYADFPDAPSPSGGVDEHKGNPETSGSS